MVERAIKLRDRIDLFCIYHADTMHGSSNKKAQTLEEKDHLLKNDTLNAEDWLTLAEVIEILKPFHDLTKRAEGTKLDSDRGVLSDYMTTLNQLLDHVRVIRDDLNFKANDQTLTSPSIIYLRTCIVNYQTKLDEYFSIINDTLAHYALVVTTPKMKWKYFEHTWKDTVLWKDTTNPASWLPRGKRALESIWKEYKEMLIPSESSCEAGRKRTRSLSPDDFERATDMTLLGDNDDEADELAIWLKEKPFHLEKTKTLP